MKRGRPVKDVTTEVLLTIELLDPKSREWAADLAVYLALGGKLTANLRDLIVKRLRQLAKDLGALPKRERKNARLKPTVIEAEVARCRVLLKRRDPEAIKRARKLGFERFGLDAAIAIVAQNRGRSPGTIKRQRFPRGR